MIGSFYRPVYRSYYKRTLYRLLISMVFIYHKMFLFNFTKIIWEIPDNLLMQIELKLLLILTYNIIARLHFSQQSSEISKLFA